MTMTEMPPETMPVTDPEERPLKPALLRGWRCRCPNCGAGPMMRGYLKVRDACPVCQQELFHHRADDGPAYLTILIVGPPDGAADVVHLHPLAARAAGSRPRSFRSAAWRCRSSCCRA
jgi:hypothetical protein